MRHAHAEFCDVNGGNRMTEPDLREIAGGLRFPEGPVALPDGPVLVVEIEAARLTRVAPDGSKTTVSQHTAA